MLYIYINEAASHKVASLCLLLILISRQWWW